MAETWKNELREEWQPLIDKLTKHFGDKKFIDKVRVFQSSPRGKTIGVTYKGSQIELFVCYVEEKKVKVSDRLYLDFINQEIKNGYLQGYTIIEE